MDQEAGATAHTVGGVGVQVVAVVHALESAHVAESVATLGQRANVHLALAGRVVAARAGSTTASAVGVDLRAIIAGTIEMVATLGVGVRTTGGGV